MDEGRGSRYKLMRIKKADMIEELVKKRLNKTLDCTYKKAYIPKGWAHIHIETFAKELAKELKEVCDGKR